MAQGYWAKGYFKEDFWNDDYWAPSGAAVGRYWKETFWNDDFWNVNFWSVSGVGSGDIFQASTPNLTFTGLQHDAGVSFQVQATTPSLSFTVFQADANLDIDPPLTTASLALTPLNPVVTLGGYQLGDIDLRWVPDSAISLTFGVVGTAPNLTFTSMAHTIEEGGGINVAASLPSIGFTVFSHDAQLNIDVQPLPASLGFTAINHLAGAGQQIPATQPVLSFSVATHTIDGISADLGVIGVNAPAALNLASLKTTIVGSIALQADQIVETICLFQEDAIVRDAACMNLESRQHSP